jgi:hypothetical protein
MVLLVVQTAGCGLLLYPERQGRKSGRIDPGVAILDAAGLVVFVVPGLIAFGVDFITGCIYLPGGRQAASPGTGLTVVRVDAVALDRPTLEGIIATATGRDLRLDHPALEARAVAGPEELRAAVAAAL